MQSISSLRSSRARINRQILDACDFQNGDDDLKWIVNLKTEFARKTRTKSANCTMQQCVFAIRPMHDYLMQILRTCVAIYNQNASSNLALSITEPNFNKDDTRSHPARNLNGRVCSASWSLELLCCRNSIQLRLIPSALLLHKEPAHVEMLSVLEARIESGELAWFCKEDHCDSNLAAMIVKQSFKQLVRKIVEQYEAEQDYESVSDFLYQFSNTNSNLLDAKIFLGDSSMANNSQNKFSNNPGLETETALKTLLSEVEASVSEERIDTINSISSGFDLLKNESANLLVTDENDAACPPKIKLFEVLNYVQQELSGWVDEESLVTAELVELGRESLIAGDFNRVSELAKLGQTRKIFIANQKQLFRDYSSVLANRVLLNSVERLEISDVDATFKLCDVTRQIATVCKILQDAICDLGNEAFAALDFEQVGQLAEFGHEVRALADHAANCHACAI